MELLDNVARKSGPRHLLEMEHVKSSIARAIGEDTGMFYVPEVVNRDSQCGVIDFERIVHLRTIQDLAIRHDDRLLKIIERAGRSLALVHQRMTLRDDMQVMLPKQWSDRPDDNVFIHGDYTCANVCFDEESERLVIVDWSTASYLNSTGTFGSKYFDIMWFAASVYHSMPLKCVAWWNSQAIVEVFLAGYSSVSHPGLSFRDLQHYHRLMCRLYGSTLLQRTWTYPLPGRLMYVLFQTFVLGRMFSCRPGCRALTLCS